MLHLDYIYACLIIYLNSSFASFAPHALNQRSPAEGKGKGQKLLAQGIALGYYGRKPVAL